MEEAKGKSYWGHRDGKQSIRGRDKWTELRGSGFNRSEGVACRCRGLLVLWWKRTKDDELHMRENGTIYMTKYKHVYTVVGYKHTCVLTLLASCLSVGVHDSVAFFSNNAWLVM